jgi:hypothetical protein
MELINAWVNALEKTNMKHTDLQFESLIQGDVHLMITIQKVTSNVQSVPCQSPDIY